ncbi:hypothetical protein [Streptomyces sp. NPDC053755]
METALISVVGPLLGVVATHRCEEERAHHSGEAEEALDRFIASAAPGVR